MRFGVLGPLLVADGTGGVRPIAGARQRVLLAALLLRANRVVPAGELAEIVWDGEPPPGAAALRTRVMRLRQLLGGDVGARIVTRGSGYVITLDDEELDAARFEALYRDAGAAVRAGRWVEATEAADRALGLWRGPALMDVDSQVLREEWAGHLGQLRVQTAEWRVEAEMHQGHHEQLVPELRDLTQRHPLREHVHAQLMLALFRCGRQAEALDAYRHARRVLVEDLGVEPGAALRELHRRILAGDPALVATGPERDDSQGTDIGHGPAAVQRQLPASIPHFTGRADVIKTLTGLAGQAADGGSAVVISAIDGMPGIGKTALAVRIGHLVAYRFPDRQLFVDLHGHTPGQPPADPADVLAALLAADGVDPRYLPASLDGRAAMWRDRMAGLRALLILDNATSSAQVAPLLPGTAGCLVLVTSRQFLGDLPAVLELPLDVLPPGDARAMFTNLAPRVTHDAGQLAELVALCGYLPLAISLLASLFNRHTSWDIADLIAETRERLLTVTAENRTVAAAFGASYHDLDPRRQRFFRYLGLPPGPEIDAHAAAALAGLPIEEAATHLDALHGDRLIEERVPRRYRMHDLIRHYAQLLTDEDTDDREQALERLIGYYQHAAEAADTQLARITRPAAAARVTAPTAVPGGQGQYEARAWMTAERANLIACISYAGSRHEAARVVGLTAAIAVYLRSEGPWPLAVCLHAAAVRAAQDIGDRLGEANALNNLGDMRRVTGDYLGAADALERALEISRSTGDRLGEACALLNLGLVRQLTDHQVAAADLLEQALEISRALGDRLCEANVLTNLGSVRRVTGDYLGAADVLERALDISRDGGSRLAEANALLYLGAVRQATGDLQGAADTLAQALDIYRSTGDRLGEANALCWLGDVRRVTGDFPGAAAALERSLDIYSRIGSRLGEANVLCWLGTVRQATGDLEGAADVLVQSLDTYRAIGDRLGEATALCYLGTVRLAAGNLPGAADSLERSLDIYRGVSDRSGEAEALNQAGTVYLAGGDSQQARACHRRALELARAVGLRLEEARALEGIGKCAAQLPDARAADSALRQALDIYQCLGAADAVRLTAERVVHQGLGLPPDDPATGAVRGDDPPAARSAGQHPGRDQVRGLVGVGRRYDLPTAENFLRPLVVL